MVDQRALRIEDEDIARATPTDRDYWNEHAAIETVKLVDERRSTLPCLPVCRVVAAPDRYFLPLSPEEIPRLVGVPHAEQNCAASFTDAPHSRQYGMATPL